MADRANTDPIQDILDELDQVQTRETELLVQLSALLRAAQGPPAPARAPTRIRLRREGYPDSEGNLVFLGARVRFLLLLAPALAPVALLVGQTALINYASRILTVI